MKNAVAIINFSAGMLVGGGLVLLCQNINNLVPLSLITSILFLILGIAMFIVNRKFVPKFQRGKR